LPVKEKNRREMSKTFSQLLDESKKKKHKKRKKHIICPFCRMSIPLGSKECPECGRQLNDGDQDADDIPTIAGGTAPTMTMNTGAAATVNENIINSRGFASDQDDDDNDEDTNSDYYDYDNDKEDCDNCSGTGNVSGPSGDDMDCPNCAGQGFIKIYYMDDLPIEESRTWIDILQEQQFSGPSDRRGNDYQGIEQEDQGCQCEAGGKKSVCGHPDQPCERSANKMVKTIYGPYLMCPECARAMPSEYLKESEYDSLMGKPAQNKLKFHQQIEKDRHQRQISEPSSQKVDPSHKAKLNSSARKAEIDDARARLSKKMDLPDDPLKPSVHSISSVRKPKKPGFVDILLGRKMNEDLESTGSDSGMHRLPKKFGWDYLGKNHHDEHVYEHPKLGNQLYIHNSGEFGITAHNDPEKLEVVGHSDDLPDALSAFHGLTNGHVSKNFGSGKVNTHDEVQATRQLPNKIARKRTQMNNSFSPQGRQLVESRTPKNSEFIDILEEHGFINKGRHPDAYKESVTDSEYWMHPSNSEDIINVGPYGWAHRKMNNFQSSEANSYTATDLDSYLARWPKTKAPGRCPDCKGKGQYTGFTSGTTPCTRCQGKGMVNESWSGICANCKHDRQSHSRKGKCTYQDGCPGFRQINESMNWIDKVFRT
jgi:hypothetical protein